MDIKEENKRKSLERLREQLKGFSAEGLAWDFHCNLSEEVKELIRAEAVSRGINLCRVAQKVEDGCAHRPACGLDHMRPPER